MAKLTKAQQSVLDDLAVVLKSLETPGASKAKIQRRVGTAKFLLSDFVEVNS